MRKLLRTVMPVMLMVGGSAFGWHLGGALAAVDPGHINQDTALPLGWVVGGFVAMLSVGLWVGTTATRIKDRLERIEEQLDSLPCKTGATCCPPSKTV